MRKILFFVKIKHNGDVSGFLRLFYILSKNKIFRIFPKNIADV